MNSVWYSVHILQSKQTRFSRFHIWTVKAQVAHLCFDIVLWFLVLFWVQNHTALFYISFRFSVLLNKMPCFIAFLFWTFVNCFDIISVRPYGKRELSELSEWLKSMTCAVPTRQTLTPWYETLFERWQNRAKERLCLFVNTNRMATRGAECLKLSLEFLIGPASANCTLRWEAELLISMRVNKH